MEFNSIQHFLSKFHSLSSHPLFSTIVTLYILILIYAPSLFLRIVLSPVLNSTGIILLFLLKLGANERLEMESDCLEPRVVDHIDDHYEHLTLYSLEQRFLDLEDCKQTNPESHHLQAELDHLGLEYRSHDAYTMESSHVIEKEETRMEMDSTQLDTTMKFLKWNMKAPLEIIYEAYEGEEEDDDDDDDDNENSKISNDTESSGFERYKSLSMYNPESETDGSSDDEFPIVKRWETNDNMFFKWENLDDDREELIEISVDRYDNRCIEFCQVEEDNLIEIDIFHKRS